MDDDLCFITDTISIMSKIKEPSLFNHQEHSLSKIIREQALNYDQEFLHHASKMGSLLLPPQKMMKSQQKGKLQGLNYCNPQSRLANCNDQNHKKQLKSSANRQKEPKRRKELASEDQYQGSSDRKGNLLIFQDEEKEGRNASNSKKQKRVEKLVLFQQKTKKIEFQDLDRYKLSCKKEEPTKIRHNQEQNLTSALNLDIQSRDNSGDMGSSDGGSLVEKIMQNYQQLHGMIKQQLNMVKYQHIEVEKIEVRRMISKLQSQIRRSRIGFRGLSDSVGKASNHSGLSLSKLRTQEESEGKNSVSKKKIDQITSKVESKVIKMKSAFDYGLEPSQLGSQNELSPSEKLAKLQEEYRKELARESKYNNKLLQLDKKYNTLRANNQLKEDSMLRKTENQSGSILKRSKLLKEKISFLRNQLKETKVLFNNKIKRLKNENALLTNQSVYISNQLQNYKQTKKNNSKILKKTVKQPISTKQNLLLFDQIDANPSNDFYKATSNREIPSNTVLNDVKSLQSLNSARSLNSNASKPSIGSFNSYKSTKIESIQKKKLTEVKSPIRNKLKITSPHHLSPPPMGELKQNSFVKRLNSQKELRGFSTSNKKANATSLDVAMRQLQEKYARHIQEYNSDEYYQNYR